MPDTPVSSDVQPLEWPSTGAPSFDPDSATAWTVIFILLIGGLVCLCVGSVWPFLLAVVFAGAFLQLRERRRQRVFVDDINRQLMSRSECLHTWGDDPARLELSRKFCESVARAKKWRSNRFVPNDPVEIAFFEPSGVDSHEEVMEVGNYIARLTGRKINWSHLSEKAKDRRLLLVDLLEAAS